MSGSGAARPRERVDYTRRGKRKRRKAWVIFHRDNFQCVYCGKSSVEDQVKLEADHVVARSAGGEDTAGNLVTACRECNRSKFDEELEPEVRDRLLTLASERNRARRIHDQLPVSLGRSPQPEGKEPQARAKSHTRADLEDPTEPPPSPE